MKNGNNQTYKSNFLIFILYTIHIISILILSILSIFFYNSIISIIIFFFLYISILLFLKVYSVLLKPDLLYILLVSLLLSLGSIIFIGLIVDFFYKELNFQIIQLLIGIEALIINFIIIIKIKIFYLEDLTNIIFQSNSHLLKKGKEESQKYYIKYRYIPPPIILWILSSFSLFSWFLVITYDTPITPSNLGFLDILPPYYYIGLILLILSIVISLKYPSNKYQQYFLIILLILYTQILSPIIIGEPRIQSGAKVFSFVEYVIQNKELNSNVCFYHTWPGFFLVFSFFLFSIDNIFKLNFLIFYPIIYRFILSIILIKLSHVILENLYPNNEINKEKKYKITFLFIIFFNFADFISQDYYAPQSFGFLFFLVILIILLKYNFIEKKKYKKDFLILIILLIILYQIHLLTFLFSVCISFLWIIYQFLIYRKKKNFDKNQKSSNHRKIVYFFILIIVISILFYIFVQSKWFQRNFPNIIDRITNMNFNSLIELLGIIRGTTERLITISFRLILTSLILFFAIIPLFIFFVKNLKKSKLKHLFYTKWFMLAFFFIITISFFTIFFIQFYSDEFLQRMYLFILPIFCIIISVDIGKKIIKKKNKLALYFLGFLILSVLFLPAKFGNEKFNIIYPGEVEAAQYINQNYPGYNILAYSKTPCQIYCYNCLRYYELKSDNQIKEEFVIWDESNSHYILIGDYDLHQFNETHLIYLSVSYKYRSELFQLTGEINYYTILENIMNSSNYSSIYSNDDVLVYIFIKS